MKIYLIILSLLCATAASATENLTAIANVLYGPVKSCKSVAPGISHEYLEFDRQGRVIKEINNNDMVATYDWKDDGTCTLSITDKDGNQLGTTGTFAWMYKDNTFLIMTSETRYVAYVDDGNGRILKKIVSSDGKTAVYNYQYNDNGVLSGCNVTSPDNSAPEMQMTVASENFDKYGNPASTTANANGQEFTSLYQLTYYDE